MAQHLAPPSEATAASNIEKVLGPTHQALPPTTTRSHFPKTASCRWRSQPTSPLGSPHPQQTALSITQDWWKYSEQGQTSLSFLAHVWLKGAFGGCCFSVLCTSDNVHFYHSACNNSLSIRGIHVRRSVCPRKRVSAYSSATRRFSETKTAGLLNNF